VAISVMLCCAGFRLRVLFCLQKRRNTAFVNGTAVVSIIAVDDKLTTMMTACAANDV